MVLTKADLQQIKESLHIDGILLKLYAPINTKIGELDKTITKKIDDLDTNFSQEIKSLRNEVHIVKKSHNDLVITINESNKKIENDTLSLNGTIELLRVTDDKNSDEVAQCRDKILNLQDKITNLEKSVFHNLQHDRKWNVEIDGIPINIGDYYRFLRK